MSKFEDCKAHQKERSHDAGDDGDVQRASIDQGRTVQWKASGLSEMVDQAETKLHNGRHETRSR